jgi:DNA-binding CsgD family transcriptional regulator
MSVIAFRTADVATERREAQGSRGNEVGGAGTVTLAATAARCDGATVVVEADCHYRCTDLACTTLRAAGLFEAAPGVPGGIRPQAAVRERFEDLARAAREGRRPSAIICQSGAPAYIAVAFAVPLDGRALVSIDIRPLAPPTWSNRDLADAFGLTEREAEVTRCLLHGDPVPSIASRLRLKSGTVRQYLKVIYSKTSTTSQAQLVALLTGGLKREAANGEDGVRTFGSRP